MRRLILSVFILLSPLALFSQTDWYWEKPIKEIRFEGLINTPQTEVDPILNEFIERPFTTDNYSEIQKRLYQMDFISSMSLNIEEYGSQEGVILIFIIEEQPLVNEVVIDGNRSVRKADILDVILIKTDDIYKKIKVRDDAKAIKQLYVEKGYPDATVEYETEVIEEENRIIVRFLVNEGIQSKVETIAFNGNNFVSASTLKRMLVSKESSLFVPGNYQESNLDDDRMIIDTYYRSKGFIDFEILDVSIEQEQQEDGKKNNVYLTFYLQEGEQYTYQGVEVAGNETFSTEDIQELLTQKIGKIVNYSQFQSDFDRIKALYFNNGYVYTGFEVTEQKDEVENSISYLITVYEKPRAHIENIIISGNTKTKDHVILREFPFSEGEIFSYNKIQQGIGNLYRLQYFESPIDIKTPPGSADGLLDIAIAVEEAKTTDIQFGVTFTSTDSVIPIIGFIKWVDRNFLGEGYEFSVGADVSDQSQDLTLGFTDRWLAGVRWYGGVNFSYSHKEIGNQALDNAAPLGIEDDFTGAWVYSDDYKVNDVVVANKGTFYDGIPTATDIVERKLVPDHQYFANNQLDYNFMSFHTHNLSLSGSTGYTHITPLGWRLTGGVGLSFGIKYTDYDATRYRPALEETRNNWHQWVFNNKFSINLNLDTRDLPSLPTSGYYLSQNITYAGGLLFGASNYVNSTTSGEAHWTLFDVPINETFLLKGVLTAKSAFMMQLPQFGYRESTNDFGVIVEQESDLKLRTNSMTIARGWMPSTRNTNLEAIWDSWLEYKMPILPGQLWGEMYFNMTGVWQDLWNTGNGSFNAESFDNYLYHGSIGAGIRLTIPGLPIGIYAAKRFMISPNDEYDPNLDISDSNSPSIFEWQNGNVFSDQTWGGFDITLSFTASM